MLYFENSRRCERCSTAVVARVDAMATISSAAKDNMTAPRPHNEPARLRLLDALQVLDTPQDAILDGMVRTAATVTDCPMALVSLVADQRQWFKSRVGIEVAETPREDSFCAHAILQDEIFEIPDCNEDLRFSSNPLVTGAPHIVFYAGVPIEVDGCKIGTLCILDQQRRRLTAAQQTALRDLAAAIQHWFEELHLLRSTTEQRIAHSLFEHLSDGVFLLDQTFHVRRINAFASGLLGHASEDLVGSPFDELVVAADRPGLIEQLGSKAPASASRAVEWSMVRSDHTVFLAEANILRIDGAGCLVVVRDVTESRARRRLVRQQALALEESFAGIMICDIDFNIAYANKAALAMSGYSAEQLIGKNTSLLHSKQVPRATYESFRNSLRALRPWSGLIYYRRKDGTEYIQLATVSPLVMDDDPVTHFLFVGEDVTDKRRMSKELEDYRNGLEELVEQRTAELALAKRAAESASRAKSDFLASISHEIRTPMNGVLGIVEVLRASSLDEDQLDLADTIRDSALALLDIIDEVLDFSKIEAGHLQLEHEPLELQRLAESVCDALLPLAANRNVHLRLFVDPGLPAWIVSDGMRLRQLLNNLLGNAIKFSSGDDRPGRVWLAVDADERGFLRIVVGDNGIGMAPEVQALIFQPFVQAEGSTTRRFGGTGLGLTICKRVAESFGGRLDLWSAPGEGAIFTLTMPLTTVDQAAPPQSSSLTGLHCHLYLRDSAQASDWSAYLVAAGASTRIWKRCPSQRTILSNRPAERGVLIIDSEGDNAAIARLEAVLAQEGVPLIRVHAGTQRGCQPIDRGIVSIESGAVRRATLIEAVAIAAGRRLPALIPVVPFTKAPPSEVDAVEAVRQGRMILVAEDHDINRKVIKRQLSLLGLAADIAVDGVDALERWRSGRYALLLTDLHMPNVDGYELTRTIRAEEALRSGQGQPRRLPIVALTANALRGEAERCLALEMDDYLTKPVQLERLAQTLARWLPQTWPSGSIEPSADVVPVDREKSRLPILDASMLTRLLGDDPVVLAEVRQEFVVSATATAKSLRIAVQRGECATISALGHRLKSSAESIGAMALADCCARFEDVAITGPCRSLDGVLDEFEMALQALVIAIAEFVDTPFVPAKPAPLAEIWLVDDEPFHLDLMQRQLEALDAGPIRTHASGSAALEALAGCDSSAVLLLLDLNMPGMDGVELMRHLADRAYAGAIALVSGSESRLVETGSKLASAYKLNVLGHLHKPVPSHALRDLLERWRALIPGRVHRVPKSYGPADVHTAIEADQLVLHYQPKVSLRDGALVGVEALVRWQHPVDGLIYPDEFIHVAEANGMIDDLTLLVLDKAVAQTARWRAEGLHLRMAVNVSMSNLDHLDFPDRVLAAAKRHGVQPDDLVLEVTESTLMVDARTPLNILTRLRLRKVGLSIDDFGTGHSSLAQLRDIPFNELKIDRGFVRGISGQPTQQAIFVASMQMAHQLNMHVVAEGVEDRADWDFVHAAGCDTAQGYFISRPLEAVALLAWTREWQRQTTEECDAQ